MLNELMSCCWDSAGAKKKGSGGSSRVQIVNIELKVMDKFHIVFMGGRWGSG